MEVILLERVGRLGTVGDVVRVKNGYGRNFLLPQKKALRATDANRAVFDARRAEIEAKNASSRAEAEKTAKKLGSVSVKLVRQASEDGKLYGSVGPRDILEALKEQGGHSFDRKQIDLAAAIKNTGTFNAKIVLHPEVIIPMTLTVVRNESDIPQEVPEELRAPEEEAPAQEQTEPAAE
jgi:large subunit ribosomal protein L9